MYISYMMTKEEKATYSRMYYAANREKIRAQVNAKRDTPEFKAKEKAKRGTPEGKAKQKAANKLRYELQKDGIYRVYMLPCGYVGQTYNIEHRLTQHRVDYNRNISNYIILHECQTKAEAKRLEAIYHAIGFDGMSKNDFNKVNSVFQSPN